MLSLQTEQCKKFFFHIMLKVFVINLPLKKSFEGHRFTCVTLPSLLEIPPGYPPQPQLSEFGLKKRWWQFSHDVKKRTSRPPKVSRKTLNESVDGWLESFDGEEPFFRSRQRRKKWRRPPVLLRPHKGRNCDF
jgi:hypothetical protein